MISSFQGTYRFLSNFFPSPIAFSGKTWQTAEHVYQAAKTLDTEAREHIRQAATPGKAKHMGSLVPLRGDWNLVKVDIMRKTVRLKFRQNQAIAQALLKTGDQKIIEGNLWHDNVWGSCSCARCKSKPGLNLLGKILMEIRHKL